MSRDVCQPMVGPLLMEITQANQERVVLPSFPDCFLAKVGGRNSLMWDNLIHILGTIHDLKLLRETQHMFDLLIN